MASNGYVRRCCGNCIFYSNDREYGIHCVLYNEMWNADYMRWVSANDYERDLLMKEKHDEKCKHFTNIRDVKNQVREKFGIEKWNYNY